MGVVNSLGGEIVNFKLKCWLAWFQIYNACWSIDLAKFKNTCYTVFSFTYLFHNFKLLIWEGVLIKWKEAVGLDFMKNSLFRGGGATKWKWVGKFWKICNSSPLTITLPRVRYVDKIIQTRLEDFDH